MEYHLTVEGMRCGMCEAHVNSVLRTAFPGAKVRSKARKNRTIVVIDQEISPQEFHRALDPTGYQLTGCEIVRQA